MAKMSEEQRAELVRARQAVALQVSVSTCGQKFCKSRLNSPKNNCSPYKETGAALASRALAWGTLYAVGGEIFESSEST